MGCAYDAWLEQHLPNCTANHKGSAASMECSGLLDIYERSEEKYGAKYVEYIGDGDSKSYKTIQEVMPYGPHINIQQRMGTHLRNLKKKLSGKKLEDAKGIGGAGRLMDFVIDK